MITHKTRKNFSVEKPNIIKNYLLNNWWNIRKSSNIYIVWEIKIYEWIFTYYKSNKIYFNWSNSENIKLQKLFELVDSIIWDNIKISDKQFFIWFDESWKWEIIWNIFLSWVLIKKEIYKNLENTIICVDTKKKHNFEYWQDKFNIIKNYTDKWLIYEKIEIEAFSIENVNLNSILDKNYTILINRFLNNYNIINLWDCRFVIDDYWIWKNLQQFAMYLKQKEIEINICCKADDNYLETKLASIISKYFREKHIFEIQNNKNYIIDWVDVWSWNVNDPKTKLWLEKWRNKNKFRPKFVKKSFKNLRKIDS